MAFLTKNISLPNGTLRTPKFHMHIDSRCLLFENTFQLYPFCSFENSILQPLESKQFRLVSDKGARGSEMGGNSKATEPIDRRLQGALIPAM